MPAPNNSYVAIGGNPAFGCSGAAVQINGADQTIGLVQSCNVSTDQKTWEGKGPNGKIQRKVIYDSSTAIDATIDMDNGATLPVAGDTLTIAGYTALIDSVKITFQNEAGVSVQVSGTANEGVDTSIIENGGN